MRQARLRITIFASWLAFWIISSAVLLAAPWLRADKAIGTEQIEGALFSITGIWVPALTCLAAFWFPHEEQKRAQNVHVATDRVIAAIALTITYLSFVLVMIVWKSYFVSYDFGTKELPEGGSFQEQITATVKLALIISPIALAPINWLTGGRAKSTRAERGTGAAAGKQQPTT